MPSRAGYPVIYIALNRIALLVSAEAVTHPRANCEIAVTVRARNLMLAFFVQSPPIVIAHLALLAAVWAARVFVTPVFRREVLFSFLRLLQCSKLLHFHLR